MNANELADKLENLIDTCDAMEYGFDVQFEQAAAMIRQQADRIVELEKQNDRLLTIAEDFKLLIEAKLRGSK